MPLRIEDPLQNRRRRDILDIIEAEPGVCLGGLATRLNVQFSTVDWHVRKLGQSHLVGMPAARSRRRFHTS